MLFLILFFSLGYSINIKEENITINILNTSVVEYNISIYYIDYSKNQLSYAFLGEIMKVEGAYINNIPLNCSIKNLNVGNEILCNNPFSSKTINTTFNLVFLSYGDVVNHGNRIYEFSFSKPILEVTNKLNVWVFLPQKAFIAESNIGSSINPTNFGLSLEPSGRRIIVKWKLPNPKLGDRIDFSVLFEVPAEQKIVVHSNERNYVLYISVILSFLTLIMIIYSIIWFRKRQENKVINVLKDDERYVLEVIKTLGSGCKHKDIVNKTGFSKAKVSRILLELNKRGLIKLERVGKNTKVYLSE